MCAAFELCKDGEINSSRGRLHLTSPLEASPALFSLLGFRSVFCGSSCRRAWDELPARCSSVKQQPRRENFMLLDLPCLPSHLFFTSPILIHVPHIHLCSLRSQLHLHDASVMQ
ncbi:hypothetical protein MTO96_020370 [Rhipicephalus appendiculatus]